MESIHGSVDGSDDRGFSRLLGDESDRGYHLGEHGVLAELLIGDMCLDLVRRHMEQGLRVLGAVLNADLISLVRIIKRSASRSSANFPLIKSFSMTALAPLSSFPCCRTGIPPPPHAITICPAPTRARIASISIISFGVGEETMRRKPFPGSSMT